MKRLLYLVACLLLPSCSLLQESPPLHPDPHSQHYEAIPDEEAQQLALALRDYAFIELTREWYSAVGDDDVVSRRTLHRNAELDARLAPFASAPRWYHECWNEGIMVLPNWAEITEIRFLDAEGRELFKRSSTSPLCYRAVDGSAIDLICGTLEPLLPPKP